MHGKKIVWDGGDNDFGMEYDAANGVLAMDPISCDTIFTTELIVTDSEDDNRYTVVDVTENDDVYYPFYSQQKQATGIQFLGNRVAVRPDDTFTMLNFSNDLPHSEKSGTGRDNTSFVVFAKKQYWKQEYVNNAPSGESLSGEANSYDFPVFEVCGNPNLITGTHLQLKDPVKLDAGI